MAPQSGQIMLASRAVTGTKSVVSQQQSIETVQVMMYSSISMLCNMRKLFHHSSYESAEFAEDDDSYTFENLLKSANPPGSPSSVTTAQSGRNVLLVPLLKRNKSKRSDLCLDVLDGAFQALQRKALHSLRIGVVSNPQTTRDLLELYTFGIRYKDPTSPDLEVEGLQIQTDGDDEQVQNIDTQDCLMSLLGNIYDLFLNRSPLPGDRHLSATIRYLDQGWDPRDFTESTPAIYSLADLKGWQQKAQDFGSIDSGFQEVGLNVIFLESEHSAKRHLSRDLKITDPGTTQRPTENAEGGEGRRRIASSPESHQATTAGSPLRKRNTDNVADTFARLPVPDSIPEHPADTIGNPAQTVEGPVQGISEQPGSSTGTGRNDIQSGRVQSGAFNLDISQRSVLSASQAAEDSRVKEALHDMIQPNLVTGNIVETQPRAENSQMLNDQNTRATALAEHINSYGFLSHEKAFQLWCNQDKLLENVGRGAESSGEHVDCQCRKQHIPNVDEMVQCNICKTQQHLVCQGYVKDDPRRPPLHVCCNCLFLAEAGKHDSMKLLEELALQRQTVDLLLDEMVASEVELTQLLGASTTVQSALIDQLVSEGYVVRSAKRQTRSSQGKVELKACVDMPDYIVKLETLFDPRRIVGQHFSEFTMTDDMLSEMHQVFMSRYPVLGQVASMAKKGPQAQKRSLAETVEHRSDDPSQVDSAPRKKSRTSMAGEQMMTPRRSSRFTKVTPKMKESTFDFLINGTSLPSRGNSATKSIWLRED